MGTAILTAAKFSGAADVELDPRSADFGKLKIGDTRLDIWTGYSQYARFIAELTTAQKKSTVAGRVYNVNRKDVIDRMIQTKLSPAAGLINDIFKGETYLGEDLPPKSAKSLAWQAYQRMMPLAIQDLIDGFEQDGPIGGLISSAGIFGVGVVTYVNEVRQEQDKAAKRVYGMDWDEVGRQLGRAAQLKLSQQTPAIIEAEQEREKRFGAGTPTLMEQWRNEGEAVEQTYREAVELAAKEFRLTRNGVVFRDKVDRASSYRRQAYASRAKRSEYQDIIAYYNQPIAPDKAIQMNPNDLLRREYYQQMFSPDMYDEFGNYRFDEAQRREQIFATQHGQSAMTYIEEYRGARWLDRPAELKALEQARDALRPYWQIIDRVWAMYPPQLKQIADQIEMLERTNPQQAKQVLFRYPQILRARETIARLKKQMKATNPMISQAYTLFYRPEDEEK